MDIDTDSHIPIYKQLKEKVIKKIKEGRWTPGEYLPSESEMERKYSVSRTPIRQCLDELEQEGYIVKKKGKGSMVKSTKEVTKGLPDLSSFAEDMKKMGLEPGYEVLEIHRSKLPSYAKAKVDVEDADAILIKRIMLADGRPMAIQNSFILSSKCKELETELRTSMAHGASLYNFLSKHDIELDSAEQYISATIADEKQAKLLNIEPKAPLLRRKRFTYGVKGELIEYVKGDCRADRYEYFTELIKKT